VDGWADSYVEESAMTRLQLEMRYKMEKRIGQGGFGDVWLARDTRTGRRVAVKILALDRLPRRMVEQEVEAMRRCGSHPHVIELLAVVWVHPYGPHKNGEAVLVMELAGGGGLFERLVSEGAYTEQLASKIMRQIALAVYHLHSRGILHRDLKPENVVFDSDVADATVKLIDFGTAVALEGQGEQERHGLERLGVQAGSIEIGLRQAKGGACQREAEGLGTLRGCELEGCVNRRQRVRGGRCRWRGWDGGRAVRAPLCGLAVLLCLPAVPHS
jgi:serine/threonine protein kinase